MGDHDRRENSHRCIRRRDTTLKEGTGYRYYTPGQIERGIWIGSLGSLGFTLEETRRILAEEDRSSPVVQALLRDRLQKTRQELERLSMSSGSSPQTTRLRSCLKWNCKTGHTKTSHRCVL